MAANGIKITMKDANVTKIPGPSPWDRSICGFQGRCVKSLPLARFQVHHKDRRTRRGHGPCTLSLSPRYKLDLTAKADQIDLRISNGNY